jgi:acetyl esterase/lipase
MPLIISIILPPLKSRGWINWGTTQAFRNLVGQIALRAGSAAFIPDYLLAPEHSFPVAVKDAEACYRWLVHRGIRNITLSGDSVGGNLALGAVALSPVTDLALGGASYETRAEADPYFAKS